ncbi:MAG TPA: VOC family protein [Elusimicrobiota bacterium]|nr:VOC family protein [Elusimicrobiota bacterium]
MPKAIPDGYAILTPYLVVSDAKKAIEFYKKAFGAKEVMRMPCPETGKIMHAEMDAFGSRFMLADQNEFCGKMKYNEPGKLGGTAVMIHVYVQDCDKAFKQAVSAGAEAVRPLEDQFYGDRNGTLRDPFGHLWGISTHKKDLTPEQLEKGMKEAMEKMKAGAA